MKSGRGATVGGVADPMSSVLIAGGLLLAGEILRREIASPQRALARLDNSMAAMREDHRQKCETERERVLASLDAPVVRLKDCPPNTFYLLQRCPKGSPLRLAAADGKPTATTGDLASHPDVISAFEAGAEEVVVVRG